METYESRFASHKDELEYLYRELYTDRWYLDQLESEMAAFARQRCPDLVCLDQQRIQDPTWYLQGNMLGLTLYVDLFAGDLRGLMERVPYLQELGITYLHLMPILRMPATDNDGGYAVEDFDMVDPRFGNNADLEKLTQVLRKANISLCLDFVMNHTASTHTWAKLAQQGNDEYRQRYLTYPDRCIPDQFERTVPQVFPATAPGNFTWNDSMQRWVFTSFYPWQWDLNYANPVVLNEMIYSMLRLANEGVEIFRIDAVPYIWKQLGTTCRNLKQVHSIVRIIRIVLECVAPAVILKGEVVMAPSELSAYFGTSQKPECHLLYSVSMMVNLWSALASQDTRLLTAQAQSLLSLPANCRFLNYLRCHDDIGWGLDEQQEYQLGIDPIAHKQFLYRFYQGSFPNSYARGELYNYDPVSLDARSCGTLSSLVGLESARTPGEIDTAFGRYALLNSVMYALQGFPMLSSGDEIAQLNDYSYHEDPARRDDSRNVHRSRFNWEQAQLRNTEGTIQHRVFQLLHQLHRIRTENPCFGCDAQVVTWDSHNNRVFALRRTVGEDVLLCVSNFSDATEHVEFAYFTGVYRDLFTNREFEPGLGFDMGSHEYLYLQKVR